MVSRVLGVPRSAVYAGGAGLGCRHDPGPATTISDADLLELIGGSCTSRRLLGTVYRRSRPSTARARRPGKRKRVLRCCGAEGCWLPSESVAAGAAPGEGHGRLSGLRRRVDHHRRPEEDPLVSTSTQQKFRDLIARYSGQLVHTVSVNDEGRAWIYKVTRLRKKPVVTHKVSGSGSGPWLGLHHELDGEGPVPRPLGRYGPWLLADLLDYLG
jgi:hypothetical protein